MPLTAQEIAEQQKQAEELLFEGPQHLGFAKSLFFGQFNAPVVFPYPEIRAEERETVAKAVADMRRFVGEHIDAAAIDAKADIPDDVVSGLGRLGVLGMTAPQEYGGRGMSQQGYCRIMEVIGGHCAATAIFVNAHHSIGLRALLLFGTPDQQRRWLPPLASGRELAAFALTEPQAGSDAANVQTTATPTPDGKSYILNGEKRYITNGAIAHVLTVMARTPVPGSSETKVTALPGHAGHAWLRGARGPDAQVWHSRHGHGSNGFPQHDRPGRKRPGRSRQGLEGRPDRARLRADHVRALLHGRGQDLPEGGRQVTPTRESSSSRRSASSSW